jgi:ubiquinone/menaquinone biosynthesis C-methylase UbiE
MHDPELVFSELKLKEGDFFLDAGCGAGDYAIQASTIVGESGVVYALDIWEGVIDSLVEKAASQGIRNIRAMVSDITCQLPIKDNCIDICLIATVLHAIKTDQNWDLFKEIRRILKPGGRVAIIECKKEDLPVGPPMSMRLSPEEIENSIIQFGFVKTNLVDLGYNYLIQFGVEGKGT